MIDILAKQLSLSLFPTASVNIPEPAGQLGPHTYQIPVQC